LPAELSRLTNRFNMNVYDELHMQIAGAAVIRCFRPPSVIFAYEQNDKRQDKLALGRGRLWLLLRPGANSN